MFKDKTLLAIFIFALTVTSAFGGDLLDGGSKLQEDTGTHRKITGTVEKIESEMVFLKTQEGTTRNFGVKEGEKEGLKNLKSGDKITIELDEGNSIIDIHKEETAAQDDQVIGSEDKGGFQAGGEHRSVKGTVEAFDHIEKSITLKTEEGKTKTFEVKDAAAVKLNNVKMGDKVSLELDEQDRVMDAHS